MAGAHVEVFGSRNGRCRNHEGGLFSGGQQPFLAAEMSPGCCLCPPAPSEYCAPMAGLVLFIFAVQCLGLSKVQ